MENYKYSEFFSLSDRSSVLSNDFSPPIKIPNNCYIGLTSFCSTNSIPNLYDGRNKFCVIGEQSRETFRFPEGSYELDDIAATLHKFYPEENIRLSANLNTLRVEMYCDYDIDLSDPESLATMLGFEHKIYKRKTLHISESILDINPVTDLRVECNIAGGSYINGKPSHLVGQFPIKTDVGYAIYSEPKTVIYLPVSETNTISNITVKILDQNNDIVNFRSEPVSVSLHIVSSETKLE